jgi:ABC-type Fe3+-citrate transport system substrate-binding protein
MRQTFYYYKLEEILTAAKAFAKTEDAQEKLEEILRKLESVKTHVPEAEIQEISYGTFNEAMSNVTACHQKVVISVLKKFDDLGYKAIEKTEEIDFSKT